MRTNTCSASLPSGSPPGWYVHSSSVGARDRSPWPPGTSSALPSSATSVGSSPTFWWMTSSAVRTAPGTAVAKPTSNSHSSPGASSICWQRPSGRKSPAASPRTSIVVSSSVLSPLLSIVTARRAAVVVATERRRAHGDPDAALLLALLTLRRRQRPRKGEGLRAFLRVVDRGRAGVEQDQTGDRRHHGERDPAPVPGTRDRGNHGERRTGERADEPVGRGGTQPARENRAGHRADQGAEELEGEGRRSAELPRRLAVGSRLRGARRSHRPASDQVRRAPAGARRRAPGRPAGRSGA